MPEISVIVPVYNVEKYLHRCVDSILNQTFTDFELILVDDGSTDSSGIICDGYALKDNRIIVLHQNNSGVSVARNNGINIAQGKYVMFCDSDDYVSRTWCNQHYRAIENNEDCYVVSNMYREQISGEIIPIANSDYHDGTNYSYHDIYLMSLSSSACNKIFLREILEKIGLHFNPKIKIGEDAVFNAEYAINCNCVIYLSQPQYFYCENQSSALHRYRYDWLEQNLHPFYARVPLLSEIVLPGYCDGWLYLFITWFDVVFDSRNKMSFFEKLKYNHRLLQTEEFGFCINHASGTKENPLVMRILKTRNYYLYWIFDNLVKLKRKLKEALK